MSVSRRWNSLPSQRVKIETVPPGTMFEDMKGNIGMVTRHETHITWARMVPYQGRYQYPEVEASYPNSAEVLPLRLALLSPYLPPERDW